jgi:hypothetical protein
MKTARIVLETGARFVRDVALGLWGLLILKFRAKQ